MKKLMFGGAMLLIISVGNIAVADTTSAPANNSVPKGQIQLANADALHSTKINGIDVPFEVLTYAHTQHLGYAVTDALKVNRSGEPFYRLTLERDLNSSEYSTVYLYYNMEWWLIDEADIPKPQPKPEPAAIEKNSDDRAAPPEPTQNQEEESKPEPEKPEKPEQPETSEPTPEPEPKPTEEDSAEEDYSEEKPETAEVRDSDEPAPETQQ